MHPEAARKTNNRIVVRIFRIIVSFQGMRTQLIYLSLSHPNPPEGVITYTQSGARPYTFRTMSPHTVPMAGYWVPGPDRTFRAGTVTRTLPEVIDGGAITVGGGVPGITTGGGTMGRLGGGGTGRGGDG